MGGPVLPPASLGLNAPYTPAPGGNRASGPVRPGMAKRFWPGPGQSLPGLTKFGAYD